MKKKSNKLWKVLGYLLIFAIVICAGCFWFLNRMPDSSLSKEDQVLAILKSGGCASCHDIGAPKPFYATLPVMGPIVSKDIIKGQRFFDIKPLIAALENGKTIDEVSLSMLDFTIGNRTMPPVKYWLIHWGAYMTGKEQKLLLDFIYDTRAKNYSTALACNEFANEPICPIVDSLAVSPEKVELGYMLFHDTRLSSDNTISCASCHDIGKGGVDHKQYSEGVAGQKGGVNAPTVFNSVFNFVQFWDGRAADLAEQAAGPPMNPIEMANENWDGVIAKLNKDPEIKKRFAALYANGITGDNITNAIAEYERTLITPDSRFDLYLKGDKTAMTKEEIEGYADFKNFQCATCHAGVNIGGQSFEYMGMAADYFADRHAQLKMGLTEEDNGRFKQTKNESDKHKFKVPSLRNVAVTAPYYHDGTRAVMKDAVKDMLTYQIGKPYTEKDVESIELFLKTLTGKYQGVELSDK